MTTPQRLVEDCRAGRLAVDQLLALLDDEREHVWGTRASFDGQSTDFVEVVAIAALRALLALAPERVPIATAVSVIVRWHDHPVRIERDTVGPPHEIGHRWSLDELLPLGRELGTKLREQAAGQGADAARAAQVLGALPELVHRSHR